MVIGQAMNVLVVTGRLAEKTVRDSVQDEADVLVLDIQVAAFITPALLRRSLPSRKYGLIFVPGLSHGDFSGLEREIATQIMLGPKHAADLGFVLSFVGEMTFSNKVPACELLIEKRRLNAIEKMMELENRAFSPLILRDLKIGGNARMKVMAEVVDAAHLSKRELTQNILYFVESGADIIDLGMSLETTAHEVKNAMETARSATSVPISIDTLDPELLNAGLDAGADIVLSLNSGNINEVKDNVIAKSAAAVIVPDCSGDLASLFNNIEISKDSGIRNIIADPVLEPAGHGIAASITRYYEFRKRDVVTPLFFGAGNVTELLDADSIGINALLSGIATELDASILFTPEFSDKARGSVSELRTASMMMMLARERGSAPKDLGLDLLEIKEKRRREYGIIPPGFKEAKFSDKWHLDPAGCFKIEISQEKIYGSKLEPGKIIAKNKSDAIIGATAKEVLDTIIESGHLSRLDHAGYLGRELMKAELALKFRRSYSQDDKF